MCSAAAISSICDVASGGLRAMAVRARMAYSAFLESRMAGRGAELRQKTSRWDHGLAWDEVVARH